MKIIYVLLWSASYSAELDCEYSEFSGLTTKMLIGTQQAGPLLVGLNFDDNDSFIYSSWECPAFVASCFQEQSSPTLIRTGTERQVMDQLGHRMGYLVRDRLASYAQFEFTLVTVNYVSRMAFRDVAGAIGVGRGSSFFHQKQISISEDVGGDESVVVREYTGGPIVFVPLVGVGRWAFTADVVMAHSGLEVARDEKIIFNPVLQDIVFPTRLVAAVMKRLKADSNEVEIDQDGILAVPCPMGVFSSAGIQLSLRVMGYEQPIHLLGHDMEHKNKEPTVHRLKGMVAMCPTRIRFSETVGESISIGRLLIRAVHELVLDYGTERIGFVVRSNFPVGGFEFPATDIPRFQYPRVLMGEQPQVVLFHAADKPGFYLLSHVGQPEDANDSIVCWQFVSSHTNVESPRPERIRSFFAHVDFGINEMGIVFDLTLAGAETQDPKQVFAVYIRNEPGRVKVCTERKFLGENVLSGEVSSSSFSSRRMHEEFNSVVFPPARAEPQPTNSLCQSLQARLGRYICPIRNGRVKPDQPD